MKKLPLSWNKRRTPFNTEWCSLFADLKRWGNNRMKNLPGRVRDFLSSFFLRETRKQKRKSVYNLRGDLVRAYGIYGHGTYGLLFIKSESNDPEIMFTGVEFENLPLLLHNCFFDKPDLKDFALIDSKIGSSKQGIDNSQTYVIRSDEGRFVVHARAITYPVPDKEFFYGLVSDDAKKVIDSNHRA